MVEQFSPRTYQIVIEGIAKNLFLYPHFRAFIETDSDSPTVMMTTNDVTEPHKVDFQSATGGTRDDDGRHGIFVYMRWSGTPRMGDAITITVWRLGATSYGEPEPMPEVGFDPENPTGMFKQGQVGPHPAR